MGLPSVLPGNAHPCPPQTVSHPKTGLVCRGGQWTDGLSPVPSVPHPSEPGSGGCTVPWAPSRLEDKPRHYHQWWGFTGAAVCILRSGVIKPSRSGVVQGQGCWARCSAPAWSPPDTRFPWRPFLLTPSPLYMLTHTLTGAVPRAVVPTAYVNASVWGRCPLRKEAVLGVPQFPYLKQKPMGHL